MADQKQPETIHIAVASNFTFAMKELINQFESNTGHTVKAAYGSSGKIYAQIQHGAPFQIFFSADQAKPVALEEHQMIVSGSRFTYAIGALVLLSNKTGSNKTGPTKTGTTKIGPNQDESSEDSSDKDSVINEHASALKSGNFNKLALANPTLAPYGAAALEVLQHLGLVTVTRSRWIQGENIAQAFQFVATGNADLGFVALSQIKQAQQTFSQREITDAGWIIPQGYYSPIKQDAVLLKRGKDSAAAKALISFIQSNQGRKIIESYGYTTASSSADAQPANGQSAVDQTRSDQTRNDQTFVTPSKALDK